MIVNPLFPEHIPTEAVLAELRQRLQRHKGRREQTFLDGNTSVFFYAFDNDNTLIKHHFADSTLCSGNFDNFFQD